MNYIKYNRVTLFIGLDLYASQPYFVKFITAKFGDIYLFYLLQPNLVIFIVFYFYLLVIFSTSVDIYLLYFFNELYFLYIDLFISLPNVVI